MLIKRIHGSNNCIYKCDRCGAEISANDKKGIYISLTYIENPKKKWDLCPKCYKALERGIENGIRQQTIART